MGTPLAEPGAVHLRETRDQAREVKFVVEAEQAPLVQEWMRANLGPDPYGGGPFQDQYSTASLYFESDTFDVFHRRGSYGRSKYRIRRYGTTSNIMFLERKFRTDRLLAKRRTIVPISDFEYLGREPNTGWGGYWFHRRVLLRRLAPLVQLSYDRTARLATSPTGAIRMTIDFNLRVLPLPDRAFLPGTGFPILEDKNIIEVKYRLAMPALVKQLVEQFKLVPQPISKYRTGLAALGLTPGTSHV